MCTIGMVAQIWVGFFLNISDISYLKLLTHSLFYIFIDRIKYISYFKLKSWDIWLPNIPPSCLYYIGLYYINFNILWNLARKKNSVQEVPYVI